MAVTIAAGADLGGVAGIFVAIPLLTVIGRHWLAWRGTAATT